MSRATPANLRSIATACGVSHVTVSRALRDDPHVLPATKTRILAAAKKLGYRPNPLVQAYATAIRQGRAAPTRSANLAWLVSEPAGSLAPRPWLRVCLAGARRRATELGFQLDTSINAHGLTDARLSRLLEARGIRAVIIPHAGFFERQPFQDPRVVTIGIDENTTASPMHTVTPDFFRNLTRAFDHLLALGYRRIGYCEHSFQTVLSQGALCGAFLFNQQRLPKSRRLPPLTGLRPVATHHLGERTRFLAWVDRHKPDAILTTFFQAHPWLESSGRRLPADLGLAHLGLLDETAAWSGIDYREADIGAAAVDLASAHLLRNETGIPATPKFMRLPGRWHHGDTTRAPAAGAAPDESIAPLAHDYAWFETNFANPAQG